jgi:Ca2+-binding RTX toxin-like protein
MTVNDTISGGAGRDTFVFAKGTTDRDTITDFNVTDDFFALKGFTQAEWDAAVAGAVITNGNVTLTFDAATSITLQNVTGIATAADLKKISVTFS